MPANCARRAALLAGHRLDVDDRPLSAERGSEAAAKLYLWRLALTPNGIKGGTMSGPPTDRPCSSATDR